MKLSIDHNQVFFKQGRRRYMCGVRGRGRGWGPNLSRPLFNNDTKPQTQDFNQSSIMIRKGK